MYMEKSLLRLKWLLVLVFLCCSGLKGFSQVLMTENFDYANGALLTASGWTAHSGSGTQPVDVVVPGLTFGGYNLSGIGGAAQLDNNGEDVSRNFTVQTSGVVYVSFMVKVNMAAAAYFLHLGGDPISTIFRGKVFVDGTADPFNFGVSVGSNTATTITGGAFNYGKTYLMVVKYEIVDGDKNDKVSLFVISSDVPATEPATPAIGPLADAAQTDINPGTIALRQSVATQNFVVDGIRIAKTWAEAVGSSSGPDTTPPVFTSGYPKVANIGATQADLQVNLDEAGKAFYVVVKDGDPAPTAAQVFTGSDYGTVKLVKSGSILITAGGTTASVTLSGLVDKTNYDIYVIAQDDEPSPNKQSSPVKTDLYTQKPADIIVNATFETSLAPFTPFSVKGDQIWNKAEFGGNSYAYINGYAGGNNENKDWLISPSINLDTLQMAGLSFSSATKYTGPAIKVLISKNFNGKFTETDINAATWTDITSKFTLSTGNFVWAESGEYNFQGFSGKVHVSFLYESSTSEGAAWEIDNVKVTGYFKNTGFTNLTTGEITLYPVPAREEIRFSHIQDVKSVDVLDLQGKIMCSGILGNTPAGQLNIHGLSGGVYLIRFNKPEGPVILKFIKE